MVRFIPDYSILNSDGQRQEAELLSNQLTNGSGHVYCDAHPNYQNVVLFAVGNGTFGVKLHDICCEKFKQQLTERFKDNLY